MCSRFELNSRPRDLTKQFGFDDLPDAFTSGEVRPTDSALVLGSNGFQVLPWGLKVDWDTKPLINARAETLEKKKTFQPLLINRCLVPATAYFEWRRDGRQRLKNRIATEQGGLFVFAGLSDGTRFTIITCAPLAIIADIHNRMPVILKADAATRWVNGNLTFSELAPLLLPDATLDLSAEEDVPPPPAQPDLFG